MLVSTKAIVISAIKYQEKALIVKCFTRTDGLQNYFIPNAFSSNKRNQKIAYFQPLSILQLEAQHKKKGNLDYIKEIQVSYLYHDIPTNIFKSTMILFLSEVLNQCIREEEKNIELFDFLEASLIWVDNSKQNNNAHLTILIKLTQFLGFYPDVKNIDTLYFDKLEGTFSNYYNTNSLDSNESEIIKKLLSLNFSDNTTKISNQERQFLLNFLIDYYILHLDGFKKPKSLEVLSEVFS